MKKKSIFYNIVNILLLLVSAVYIYLNYVGESVFGSTGILNILIVFFSVVIVHSLKAVRLYFALYGVDISFMDYLKIYCKVTPVSILLPFKSGELFRMYCYGIQTGNMLKGIITVVLDRFMDTIALLTLIITMLAFYGGERSLLLYVLIFFIIFVMIIISVFPGTYRYWTKTLLRSNATARKIRALKLLDNLNLIYVEISDKIKGRGIILYVLSLLAWGVEIGSMSLVFNLNGGTDLGGKITEYLSSALVGDQSVELKQFVFISVILMIFIYILVKLFGSSSRERK